MSIFKFIGGGTFAKQKVFENLHASGAKKKRQNLLKFTHKRVVDHVLMKKAFQLIKFDVHITHHTV